MSSTDGDRRGLAGATLAFVALHVFHARVQGGGGWKAHHGGLWGAVKAFFRLSLRDPVMSAGLSDFAVLAAVFGTAAVADLPAEHRWGWRTRVWLVVYAVFPGLGALLHPLWLKPAARAAA